MGREAVEKKRNKELVELRKKYLAKKGKKPAAKKKATKPKLTGRNKELARLEKEHKQLLMRYKKKERGGKEEGYITSGAGDDLDFIIKMFQK